MLLNHNEPFLAENNRKDQWMRRECMKFFHLFVHHERDSKLDILWSHTAY